jgi:hypothetical protein
MIWDSLYLQAIDVLYNFYHRNRNPVSKAIPGEVGNPRSNNLLLWLQSNLGLAIDLRGAAPKLPPGLGSRLKEMALEMFFDVSSPLPKASSMHGHYCKIQTLYIT